MPLRPPWAIIEHEFIETCTRCTDCVKQCPQNIIRIADGGFPEINVSEAGCDFCQACVQACLPNALNLGISVPFNCYATINDNCFSERGVICRSCGEVCEVQAIKFKQVVGGITHVAMETLSCTGCGECISVCPAFAISLQHRD